MIPSRGETYRCLLYKRKKGNEFEYEEKPCLTFYARVADNFEISTYQIINGVEAKDDSINLISTHLPKEVEPNDVVVFLGQRKLVSSVGIYLDSNCITNAKIFSSDYLMKRSPKGLVLS